MPAATDPAVHDHLRPIGPGSDADSTTDGSNGDNPAPVEPGVYLVVGTHESSATLLRVGDAGARRVNSGRVVTVDREALAAFEPADNPDGNRPTSAAALAALSDQVWRFRTFVRGLLARPIPSAAAFGLLAVGLYGDRALSLPEPWLTVATVAGIVGLAVVGGRGG